MGVHTVAGESAWLDGGGKKEKAGRGSFFKGDVQLPDAWRQLLLRNPLHFTLNMSSVASK